jgi:hypothetical protein
MWVCRVTLDRCGYAGSYSDRLIRGKEPQNLLSMMQNGSQSRSGRYGKDMSLKTLTIHSQDMAQSVSGRPQMVEPRFQTQANAYGICDGRSGTERGLSPTTSVFSHKIILPMLRIHILFIKSLTLSDLNTRQRC